MVENWRPYKSILPDDRAILLEKIIYDPTIDPETKSESDPDLLTLHIKDSGTDAHYHIIFDWIYSIRVCSKGNLGNTPEQKTLPSTSGIFTIENSRFLTWFIEQGLGILHANEDIHHYAIVMKNEVIHILSVEQPVFKAM